MNRVTKLLGTAVLAVSMMVSFTGCQGLYDEIDELEKELAGEKVKNAELQAELDSVTATQTKLDELQNELDAIKASDSADDATITSIEEQIKAISKELSDINKSLSDETEDVDADDYADEISELEARIESLEKQLEEAKNTPAPTSYTITFTKALKKNGSIHIYTILDKAGYFSDLTYDYGTEHALILPTEDLYMDLTDDIFTITTLNNANSEVYYLYKIIGFCDADGNSIEKVSSALEVYIQLSSKETVNPNFTI